MSTNIRIKSLKWWNILSFEQKFINTIAWLSKNGKDTTERHPDDLTGREVQEIYEMFKF